MVVSIQTKPKVEKKAVEKPAKPSELTVIQKVIKGDTFMVMNSSAFEPDDEFVNLYVSQNSQANNLAIEPPFNPRQLRQLASHNNVLNQCVAAMEVNIDGTGHEFVPVKEGDTVSDAEKEAAANFFDEPYPGQSFIAQRRNVRRDLEILGYGYLEVLRNIAKEVVAVRYIDAATLRLVKLGDPVLVQRKVMRNGKEIELTLYERPRRFLQLIAGKTRKYFKEFDTPLDLDKDTGEWVTGASLPAEKLANELIFFTVDKDFKTAYGVPRWINQIPSVVGSRKAEEQNLEFFDSGGMPPAIIFIQGGQAAGDSANQLRTYLSNGNKKKGRAVVVELTSTSGNIDSNGAVSAKVEHFGAERANDSMYEKYDKNVEDHVRVGFRLPPLFLGRASDYNYATAVVAYQVAEAQVFQPERGEFDEVINKTLVRAMGWKTLKFRSLPIIMKSVGEKFKGLDMIKDKVEPDQFVAEVNKTIGTGLEYKEPDPVPQALIDPFTGLPYKEPVAPQVPQQPAKEPEDPGAEPQPPGVTKSKVKKMSVLESIQLARRYAEATALVPPMLDLSDAQKQEAIKKVEALEGEAYSSFESLLATCIASWMSDPHAH